MACNNYYSDSYWLFCDNFKKKKMSKYHYWITCNDPETGKAFLLYAVPAREGETAARQRGFELLGSVDFELKKYPTMDRVRASAILRGKRQEQSHSLRESSRRIGHERSIKFLGRRKKKKISGEEQC